MSCIVPFETSTKDSGIKYMYDVELRRTERILKRKYFFGKLKDKEIYLFGVSDNTRQIIGILRDLGVNPKNVIDNDKIKQGSYCSRLKVIPMQDIINPADGNKIYILYSGFWREMIPQLQEYGVAKKNIWRLNRKPGLLTFLIISAYKGKRYRNKLIKRYGDKQIFLCPYTGTGDIYLIGTFWDEYIKQNNIDDYIFVVITGACKKVASLFNIKNIVLTKKKEYGAFLIDYYMLDREKGNITILNDCWAQVHTNQVEWFRGYKELYFTQLFKKFVFGLPDDVKPRHPQYKDESERIGELFKKYNLVSKRTVVLSPYSNTLSDLPEEFWEELVKALKEKGYVLVTNCGGKSEPAVEGTIGVFFPLDIAPQFIAEAGNFIGVRSGFCDVISGADAKKIILYDRGNRFYMGSAFEYFNLKEMELCDDAVEIEFEHGDLENVVSEIVMQF